MKPFFWGVCAPNSKWLTFNAHTVMGLLFLYSAHRLSGFFHCRYWCMLGGLQARQFSRLRGKETWLGFWCDVAMSVQHFRCHHVLTFAVGIRHFWRVVCNAHRDHLQGTHFYDRNFSISDCNERYVSPWVYIRYYARHSSVFSSTMQTNISTTRTCRLVSCRCFFFFFLMVNVFWI